MNKNLNKKIWCLMFPTYSPRKNPIHFLPTSVKLVHVISSLACLIMINHPFLLGACIVGLLGVFVVAGEMEKWLWYARLFGVLGIVYLLLTTMFSDQGETNVFLWITLEELIFSLSFGIKLFLSVSVFILFSLTVHPDEIFGQMSRKGLHSALALSIAWRLFPTLARDSTQIYEAHISRGIPLDRGNVISRSIRKIPLLIPLLSNTLERTNTLSQSMECRGFGRKRSHNVALVESPFKNQVKQTKPGVVGSLSRSFNFFKYSSGQYSRNGQNAWVSRGVVLVCVLGSILVFVLTRFGGWGMTSAYTTLVGLSLEHVMLGLISLGVLSSPLLVLLDGGEPKSGGGRE